MSDALNRLLAGRDWLLADGATGTNLFNMGLTAGEAPELWNVERPDNVRKLYQGAIDAGHLRVLADGYRASMAGAWAWNYAV